MNDIRSIRTFLILLVAAFSVSVIMGYSVPACAASEKASEAVRQADDERRKKIRKMNDLRQKAQDPLFPEQARSLAKDYKTTAEIIARQGGDPKPVLDAAAYFESQAELVSTVRVP